MKLTVRCETCGKQGTMEGTTFPEGWGPGTESFTYRCEDHLTDHHHFGTTGEWFVIKEGAILSGPHPSYKDAVRAKFSYPDHRGLMVSQ